MESILLAHTGLNTKEVLASRKKNGTNQIDSRKKNFILQIIVRQTKSAYVYLLLVGALLSFLIGDMHDGLIILAVVIVNFIIGFYQEYKSEITLQALQKLTHTTSRVLRDNQIRLVESHELVVGDLILLGEGERVGADVKLLFVSHLEVDESTITGENLPVLKDEKSHEMQLQLCFAGTTIVAGDGLARVITVGSKTMLGQINTALAATPSTPTPLQQKLSILTKYISQFALLVGVGVFLLMFLKQGDLSMSVIFVISVVVAIVPEGLPGVISVTLAVAVERLAKKNAIVRNISAVEGLSTVTLIATDKTGTLTKNQMHVRAVLVDGHLLSREISYQSKNQAKLQELIEAFLLSSPKKFVYDHRGEVVMAGNSTQNACGEFLQYFEANYMHLKKAKIIDALPFDQKSKRTTTDILFEGKKYTIYQGAPEYLLEDATHIYEKQKLVKLDSSRLNVEMEIISKAASEGYRLVAVASKYGEKMVYFGALVLEDPVREEVFQEIKNAKKFAIKVVMITGDSELTAARVAREVGILDRADKVITGREIDMFDDGELIDMLPQIKVFARVTPTQKHRIVTLFQRRGEIVAVTGDGVNDSIALKSADVGIAMGRGGSEVAKEIADIILTDDNFTTIYQAIVEAKKVVLKIQKSVEYIFCTNIIELLVVLGGFILLDSLIFNPIQLLYINLITDTVPSLAFGFSKRILAPQSQSFSLITGNKFLQLFSIASMFAVVFFTLNKFHLGYFEDREIGTLAFICLILAQVVVFLYEYLSSQKFKNRIELCFDAGLSSSLVVFLGFLIFIYTVQPLRNWLHLELISKPMVWFVVACTVVFQLGFFAINRLFLAHDKSR